MLFCMLLPAGLCSCTRLLRVTVSHKRVQHCSKLAAAGHISTVHEKAPTNREMLRLYVSAYCEPVCLLFWPGQSARAYCFPQAITRSCRQLSAFGCLQLLCCDWPPETTCYRMCWHADRCEVWTCDDGRLAAVGSWCRRCVDDERSFTCRPRVAAKKRTASSPTGVSVAI